MILHSHAYISLVMFIITLLTISIAVEAELALGASTHLFVTSRYSAVCTFPVAVMASLLVSTIAGLIVAPIPIDRRWRHNTSTFAVPLITSFSGTLCEFVFGTFFAAWTVTIGACMCPSRNVKVFATSIFTLYVVKPIDVGFFIGIWVIYINPMQFRTMPGITIIKVMFFRPIGGGLGRTIRCPLRKDAIRQVLSLPLRLSDMGGLPLS